MGDVNSSVRDKAKLEQLLEFYVQSGNHQSSLFSNDNCLYLHKQDARKMLLLREFVYGGESLFEKGKNIMVKRSELSHENLSKIIGIFDRSSGDWCSHVHILTVVTEHHPSSLATLIIQRSCSVHLSANAGPQSVPPFTEEEILNMILGISKAQVELKKALGFVMADLHPDYIQLDSSGVVKLQDISIYNPDGHTGYLRMLRSNNYRSPISPEQLREFSMRITGNNDGLEKSSVFSLGIIMLGAATGVNFEYFYDLGAFKIKYNLVHDQFQLMQKIGISRWTIGFIGNALNEDPKMRPTYQEIVESLERHQRKAF